MNSNNKDNYYMMEAYKEALIGYSLNEVPIGCVIVCGDEIVGRGHNLRHTNKCSIDHAEMIAIREASKKLNRWILSDCTLYVTVEPCLMCAGAIVQARIPRLVYGTHEERFGCALEIFETAFEKQGHKVTIDSGYLEEDISKLMKSFFQKIRNENKN